jgi:putative colanic acid biosynthesis UDP-glucose lipid carrier transferase
MARQKSTPPIRKASDITIARDNILYITESLLEPIVIVFSLWFVAFWDVGSLTPPYLILSVILFYLTFPSGSKINKTPWKVFRNTALFWIILAGLVLMFGIVTGYITLFSPRALKLWLWLTLACLLLAVFGLRASAPFLLKLQGPQKRAVVAGMNDQGIALAESLMHNDYTTTVCLGFFDDRQPERLPNKIGYPILGKFADITEYVKQHHINVIYLSLPMDRQPRIIKLFHELKDTTASIYFLPDIFLSGLIHGRMGEVDGIPVVEVCETPFTGINGVVKHLSDIGFALIILTLISPLLLAISIGVKLSSPGPIIFKQRRYGLDGKEILVYKFRSMTVCEDGSNVVQATKQDARVTPLGAYLRKTSLDELPQFINVLQGRMSIVGPRPHAVAHDHMYRGLIKGYMIRHKVKPGITGWAQVNGLRGETDMLDKMQGRIDYDIDYLRNWSLRLDVYIILKTVWIVAKGLVAKGQDGAY